jgi:hypothetical protein
VSLEVLDADGALVRRYASNDPLAPSAEELAAQLIPPYWVATPTRLATSAGMHRWVWDLHYAAPLATTHGYPISAVPHATPRGPEGPRALPGKYRVRLSVAGRISEVPLIVRADPRVVIDGASLAAQLRLAQKLAGLMTDSARALLEATSVREQVKALKADAKLAGALHEFDEGVAKLLEAPTPAPADAPRLLPALQDDFASLYAEVTRSDAAPTAAQVATVTATEAAFAAPQAAWAKLRAGIPALNARLKAAHLAPIRPEQLPARDLNSANEE